MKKWYCFILVFALANISQAQWWPDVRVTYDNWDSYTSLKKCIDSRGDTVHAAWYQDGDNQSSILYARSTDAGLHWDNEAQLTDDSFDAVEPALQASGSFVHMVWMDYRDGDTYNVRLYYKRSADAGLTWEDDLMLTDYGGIKWYPELAVSGNYVHLVWYEQCNDEWEVFYMRSTDNGATWGESNRLTFDPGLSVFCSIAASGPVLHLCWHDNRDGNKEIYYKSSAEGGINWSDDRRLTYHEGDSRIPEIDACDPFVHVVWQDNRDGDYSIYYIGSQDGGVTWGQETELTPISNTATAEYPSVAAAGKIAHVVWQEYVYGNSQIFYKCSTNGGLTWDENVQIVNTLYDAFMPSVDFSGEWLHVLWYDYRNGSSEIYCKNEYIQNPETGQFAFMPFEVDFKEVYVNGFNIDSLQIFNYGMEPLRIDSIFIDVPFSVSLDTKAWTNKIKNIDIIPADLYGKATIYTRFYGMSPGSFTDSISIVIEDSVYYIRATGVCKESQGVSDYTEGLKVYTYPNPFYDETRIDFIIDHDCEITLDVFDSKATRIDHLVINNLTPGLNSITWKGKSFPQGLYFFRLNDGERIFNGKLIKADN